MASVDERALTRMSSHFAGCECLGTVEMEMFGGDAEVYKIPGVTDLVGAWYPDGALMLWPRSWLDRLEGSKRLGPAPDVLRWEQLLQKSKTSAGNKGGGGVRRGGANRVVLKRGKAGGTTEPDVGRGI